MNEINIPVQSQSSPSPVLVLVTASLLGVASRARRRKSRPRKSTPGSRGYTGGILKTVDWTTGLARIAVKCLLMLIEAIQQVSTCLMTPP